MTKEKGKGVNRAVEYSHNKTVKLLCLLHIVNKSKHGHRVWRGLTHRTVGHELRPAFMSDTVFTVAKQKEIT